jgi:diguanylate cyclase (GGDEF)-like protein/PAS domain S-box-containing protein
MRFVLILDGRGGTRRSLARLAEGAASGVSALGFGDPREALSWLESHEAELVITGFRLPRLDGAEVTRRLRAMPRTADVPVLVVTAPEDAEARRRALEAGATDVLSSAEDEAALRARVGGLLALRRPSGGAGSRSGRRRPAGGAPEAGRAGLLRASREALARLADAIPALVSASDREGRVVFVNAAQAEAVASSRAELEGRGVAALFGAERGALSRHLDNEVFQRGEALPGFEEVVHTPDGRRIELLTTKTPLRDRQGNVTAVLSTSLDITAHKRAERRLLHLARHDPLTELPNRAYLLERLADVCARARRPEGGFALHLLDLDRFKAVNDGLGHEMGDRLLVQVARRLRAALPETALLARLGGDEFAVVQERVSGPAEAGSLSKRVLDLFGKPFRLGQRSVSVVASLGVTLCPQDSTSADELMRNADQAMYRVKRSGGAGFGFFDREADASARQAMALEAELRRALARREFELVWQPQVSLRTGRICGAEALLRWRHAEKGMVPPAQFLPLAEATGLIGPITEWALAAACAQGVAWAKRRPPGLRISANLSPSLFASRDVRGMVLQALAATGLEPSLLDIEITERALLDRVEAAASTLRSLREVGVTFSIDDFGTGYSSLAHAKTFPVQRLKVDRGFIANLGEDPTDLAIVGAIVGLAHGLGMEVVAEGVETAEQVAALRRLGCDEVQGHFLREPVTAAELTAMLDADAACLAAAPPGRAAARRKPAASR